jgi:O-acetylhomoserine (thiol)-lyase
MAAQMTALLAILKAGDHIVAASTLYGGTVGQLGIGFSRLGIETTFVDPSDPENFARAMRPNTRAVYGETMGNPLVNVLDIAAVAEVAHAHGVPLVIDNTVASPYLCNPCDWGADIVVHSATKYLAATAPPWAAWWSKAASSPGTTASSPRWWSPAAPTTA